MKYLRTFLIPFSALILALLSQCNPDDSTDVILSEVSKTTVSAISQTEAQFHAEIISDGGGDVFTKGFVFNTSGNPDENDEKLIATSDLEKITASISTLSENTQYFVRAFAINSKGIAFGSETAFSTSKTIVAAEVTVDKISDLSFTTVSLEGTVVDEGNGSVSDRGFVWSTSENPTIDLGTKKSDGLSQGVFSVDIDGLQENTMYHARAFAINEFGVTYSSDTSFTTLNSNTILEELELDESLSIFTNELKKYPNLVSLIDDENSQITVFAPTNDAINSVLSILGIVELSILREDIVEGLLAFHIVNNTFSSSDLVEGFVAKTYQGEDIEIGNGQVIISGATSQASFLELDRNAINGKIHTIESMIIPPSTGSLIVSSLGTLAEPILLYKDFSILADGIKKADESKTDVVETIEALLKVATNITLFAPTNISFEVASITIDSWTSEQWNAIVRNHIVIGQGNGSQNTLLESDLITGSQYTTTLGESLLFLHGSPQNGTGIFIDSDNDYDGSNPASAINGEVAFFDSFVKSNGRIHLIAGILVPEQ